MSALPPRFNPRLLQPPTVIPPALRHWLGSLLKGPPRGRRQRHKQACVLALGRIGDFVLCLPALRLFVHQFGADQVTLVVQPGVSSLAAIELPGVELVTLPSEAGSFLREIVPLWWRERRKFATVGFERQITLSHYRPIVHELIASWVDAKQDFRLVPATYPPAGPEGQCTELEAHRLVAAAALNRPVAWEEIIPSFVQFPAGNNDRLLVYPLSHDGSKNIPAERIISILQPWRARNPAAVVFGGSPRDAAELERYAAAARAAGLGKVSVETPAGVPAFIAHVAAAGGMLATDSAAGHVAGAFDKPAVVLIAREWYGLSQPWRKSGQQHAFALEAPDAEIAAALPALGSK